MKKIIQFISFAFIAVVLSVVSVKAQASQKFDARIPFSFSIAGKPYDAGDYKVKIKQPQGAGGIMTLLDSEGKVLDVFPVIFAGESTASDSRFVFSRTGNDRALTKIVTTETSFKIPQVKSKPPRQISRKA